MDGVAPGPRVGSPGPCYARGAWNALAPERRENPVAERLVARNRFHEDPRTPFRGVAGTIEGPDEIPEVDRKPCSGPRRPEAIEQAVVTPARPDGFPRTFGQDLKQHAGVVSEAPRFAEV